MAKNGFKVFDSDMHIMEPPDLWERYIAPEFRPNAPRGRTSENVRDLGLIFPNAPQAPPTRVITTKRTRASIAITRSAVGPARFSSRRWMSKVSMSPCCFQPAGWAC